MCELMGMCFAEPVPADFSIRHFAARGEENADGWGLAWYPDQSVALVKEPLRWGASEYPGFLETYTGIRSSLYLAHVRRQTTGGAPTHADTHPFVRELFGQEFCFAHNGTLVPRVWELPLGRFHPLGNTDSEWAFCYLLDQLAQRGRDLTDESDLAWLLEQFRTLNKLGQFNCLLSDGQRLFCYHDRSGYKGLTLRKVRIGQHTVRHFEDSDLQVNLEGDTINHGFVVATHPLSKGGWHNFSTGELKVFDGGLIRFSSKKKTKLMLEKTQEYSMPD